MIKIRNLTIKRAKSFVGCLAKNEIYIEDPTSTEFLINNTPCRKLGDLKDGEQKTFQIDNNEVKVFIIADKSSNDYCKTYFQLFSGNKDLFISGKNAFDQANAFHFDKNQSIGYIVKDKNNPRKKPLLLSIAKTAITSPFLMYFFTLIWSWMFGIGFGIEILGYSTIPNWILIICLLPLSFSPLIDIFGIILGIVKIKERHSILCIILSVLGLIINFALIFGTGYIGSRY